MAMWTPIALFEKEGGHYTYWDMRTGARKRNVGWRIDYFYISKDLVPHLKNAYIESDVQGSDHCPIGIEIDLRKLSRKKYLCLLV